VFLAKRAHDLGEEVGAVANCHDWIRAETKPTQDKTGKRSSNCWQSPTLRIGIRSQEARTKTVGVRRLIKQIFMSSSTITKRVLNN